MRTITLTNNRSSSLVFSQPAYRLTGRDAEVFAIVACPLESALDPGETREIRLRVASDATDRAIERTAILEVWPEDDAPSGVDLLATARDTGGNDPDR